MNKAFLNGEFMPLSEAKISPMDRGFLFGEGIYEVIPSYEGRFVGWQAHMQRLFSGLARLEISSPYSAEQIRSFVNTLVDGSEFANLAIYLHITRGAEEKRAHAYKNTGTPTVFMMCYEIPELQTPTPDNNEGLHLKLEKDRRWRNCDIKSTSLLGNVMHLQNAMAENKQETLLLDEKDFITEASSSNVFFYKSGRVITPPLGTDLLPGITRHVMLDILRKYSDFEVLEEKVSLSELYSFDEVWLTSSTKGVAAVSDVNNKAIASGKPGKVWQEVLALYMEHRFDS